MRQLTKNSTPAERARNCVFAMNFESRLAMEKNGLDTYYGSPTIKHGYLTLDGSSDVSSSGYEKYWGTGDMTVLVQMRTTDTSGTRQRIAFGQGSGQLVMSLEFNANAKFGGYFAKAGAENFAEVNKVINDGEWHTCAVTFDSSTQLITGYVDDTAGTSTDTGVDSLNNNTILYFGGNVHSDHFVGDIRMFRVFNSCLSHEEIQDYQNNSTYDYRNEAVVDLQFRAEDNDPTNVRTLDSSGNGNHATLGDGSTASSYPTKLSKHGYSFDGISEYFTIQDDATLRTSPITVMALIKKAAYIDSQCVVAQSGNNAAYETANWSLELLGDSLVFNGRTNYFLESAPSMRHGYSIVGFQADNDSSVTNLILNGKIITTNADTPVGTDNTMNISIGRKTVHNGRHYHGDIIQYIQWSTFLTPLQLLDAHISLMKKINNI